MNLYLISGLLVATSILSLVLGRVTAPVRTVTNVVYESAEIHPGEFFSVNSCEFRNSKIVASSADMKWNISNNLFDRVSGIEGLAREDVRAWRDDTGNEFLAPKSGH